MGTSSGNFLPRQSAVSLLHARTTFEITYPPPPSNTVGIDFLSTYSNNAPCPAMDKLSNPNLSPERLSVPDWYTTAHGLNNSNILSIILVYYCNYLMSPIPVSNGKLTEYPSPSFNPMSSIPPLPGKKLPYLCRLSVSTLFDV